jgi:TonB family protein
MTSCAVSTASPVERRFYARRRIRSLTYAGLGAGNGAILVDVSGGGLGFQSVVALNLGQAVLLKFKVSGGGNHIESCAEVAWLNESRKRGGLRFVELSADARVQIRAWIDNESTPEATREIHQGEGSSDSTRTDPRSSAEGAHAGPMRKTAKPKSIARGPIHSGALPIPGKELASAEWREAYLSAMRESDGEKLPERLVTAEKAILLRIALLHEDAEGLEGRALRRALDRLYALKRDNAPHAGKIVEDRDGYELERRRRAKAILSVSLAVLMSFAMGWIVARRNARRNDDARITEAASDAARASDSHTGLILGAPDTPVQSTLTQEHSPKIPPTPKATNAPDVSEKNRRVQSGINGRAVGSAIARDHGAPFENGHARESLKSSPASTPANQLSRPAENPPSQALGKLPAQPRESSGASLLPRSDRPNIEPEAPAERQDSAPPSLEAQGKPAEPQGKQQIPSGSVSVSFGTYPSIRVPPELKSQASGARLQIGSLISRVDPIYPEDAELQRIEGTVKLHAIIGRDGAVQSAEVISGPPLLVPAAVSAIRQWRYKPTLLGDQPIETGEDITIVFQLAKVTATPKLRDWA